jgi:hypothetical protein
MAFATGLCHLQLPSGALRGLANKECNKKTVVEQARIMHRSMKPARNSLAANKTLQLPAGKQKWEE